MAIINSLSPYTGTWDFHQAAHLLKRTTFGPTLANIEDAVDDGLIITIDKLLLDQNFPDPPIYYQFENDPNVPLGSTWVNTNPPNPAVGGLANARRRSVRAWTMGLLAEGGISITAKMFLFWHEHLPINGISRGQFAYKYCETILKNTLGNFKTLIEEITIDPQMLLFLNGNSNTVESPNENYARELLELFTVGRGLEAGPGDYTTYTEQDVREIARSLTGWRTASSDTGEVGGRFISNRHDKEDKVLSARFNNAVIQNEEENEYKRVIDIIFQQQEVARYLCKQLHIWFIHADITDEVEMNIINPLAEILITNNYNIKPVLATLLSSEYFYLENNIGCMITHPLDFQFKVINTMEFMINDPTILRRYSFWNLLFDLSASQEMELLGIPSVAGWKAFYQGPQYGKVWINSISLQLRERISDSLVDGVVVSNTNLELNLIDFIAKIEDAIDPNKLIEGIARIFFSKPIAQNQLDFLKNILIPGLPDASWIMEYTEYLNDPTDPDRIEGITRKLKALFKAVLKMPEFYLT